MAASRMLVRRLAFAESPAPSSASGPLVLLSHAAGFCKETWRPVLDRLAKIRRADLPETATFAAFDFSGHGSSPIRDNADLPAEDARRWGKFSVDDTVAAFQAMGVRPETGDKGGFDYIVGSGHSMGGAALLLTENKFPGIFDRFLLIEPMTVKLSLLNSVLINSRFNPLYRKTLKRQRTFASLEDAMAYFSSRRALARFHPEALAAYVEAGTQPTGEGSTRTLSCAPEFEAHMYTGMEDQWGHLHTISTPTRVLCGEMSPKESPYDFSRLLMKQLEEGMPNCQGQIAKDGGHFYVMEQPEHMANYLAETLAEAHAAHTQGSEKASQAAAA